MCAGGLLGGLWLLARPGRARRSEDSATRTRAGSAADSAADSSVESSVEAAVETPVEEYASLPAQGEPASAKEKESVR